MLQLGSVAEEALCESYLGGNPEDTFLHDMAHVYSIDKAQLCFYCCCYILIYSNYFSIGLVYLITKYYSRL